MSGYSTKQAAELIGLTPDQVRHYVRRKLVQPGRGERDEYRFTFQDVVLLRTAKGLLDASVSTRKTFRALTKLKKELTHEGSLSSVRIFADGTSVVARDDKQTWEVETGQTQLDFEIGVVQQVSAGGVVGAPVATVVSQISNHPDSRTRIGDIADLTSDSDPERVAKNVAQIADKYVRLATNADELDTDGWYNLGLDLEEMEPETAPDAYKQAIRLDPKNADAHVNLGRLFQLKGELKYAKRHYELAIMARAGHQLAYYNLGTIFDELEEIQKAAEFYENAPSIPDAHYNLARIRELQGDEVSALRHMRHYRDLIDQERD